MYLCGRHFHSIFSIFNHIKTKIVFEYFKSLLDLYIILYTSITILIINVHNFEVNCV